MSIAAIDQERKTLTQWVYLGIWLAILARGYQSLLLSQLLEPVFVTPRADNVFWGLHILGLPDVLIHNSWAAIAIDGSLLLLPLLAMLLPNWRIFSILLAISCSLYFVTFNSVSTHHEHTFLGVVFWSLVLCFKQNKSFVLGLWALRYYVCFALFSAAIWKVYRGSAFDSTQMEHILKAQHLDFMVQNPTHWYSDFINYLLSSPTICAALWYGMLVLELFFVVGFFTRRLDKFLLYFVLLFFFADYWVMNLAFFEFCIFAFVFVKWEALEEYYQELKVV
ncbi:MAG: hypothetical protein GY810_27425 [Aureispira sp.]|nr:hypothetical protein [Aureispira sp.]